MLLFFVRFETLSIDKFIAVSSEKVLQVHMYSMTADTPGHLSKGCKKRKRILAWSSIYLP